MGFDIAEEVDQLDWDFSTLKNGPAILHDAKGTIPEPSSDQINEFSQRWAGLVGVMGGSLKSAEPEEPATEEDDEPQTLIERLEHWRRLKLINMEDEQRLADAIVEVELVVCQGTGSPTREQLTALPHRAREAFLLWLVHELIIPKAPPLMRDLSYSNGTSETSSTNGSPAALPGG